MDLRPEFFSVGEKGAKQQVEMAFFMAPFSSQQGLRFSYVLKILICQYIFTTVIWRLSPFSWQPDNMQSGDTFPSKSEFKLAVARHYAEVGGSNDLFGLTFVCTVNMTEVSIGFVHRLAGVSRCHQTIVQG